MRGIHNRKTLHNFIECSTVVQFVSMFYANNFLDNPRLTYVKSNFISSSNSLVEKTLIKSCSVSRLFSILTSKLNQYQYILIKSDWFQILNNVQ